VRALSLKVTKTDLFTLMYILKPVPTHGRHLVLQLLDQGKSNAHATIEEISTKFQDVKTIHTENVMCVTQVWEGFNMTAK